jgi:hypothetical protein
MSAARFFRWAALVPLVLAAILALGGWPGVDVRREGFHIVLSYTDPARATAIIALVVLAGVSLIASIAIEVRGLREELRRALDRFAG